MTTQDDLKNWFTYHIPNGDQQKRYQTVRDAALVFAQCVLENTPSCADQTVALRRVREAVLLANQTIACNS